MACCRAAYCREQAQAQAQGQGVRDSGLQDDAAMAFPLAVFRVHFRAHQHAGSVARRGSWPSHSRGTFVRDCEYNVHGAGRGERVAHCSAWGALRKTSAAMAKRATTGRFGWWGQWAVVSSRRRAPMPRTTTSATGCPCLKTIVAVVVLDMVVMFQLPTTFFAALVMVLSW